MCSVLLSARTPFRRSLIAAADEQVGDQAGPPGLMRCSQSTTCLGMEVFVELDQLAPYGILLELLVGPERRAVTLGVGHEDVDQPLPKLVSDLPECSLVA